VQMQHLLRFILMPLDEPSGISYFELRFFQSESSDVSAIMEHAKANTTLPDIPFECFLQSSRRLDSGDIKKQFNATWTLVRGKMAACIAYQTDFLNRNGAYHYFPG
jgi:hypothetical protein